MITTPLGTRYTTPDELFRNPAVFDVIGDVERTGADVGNTILRVGHTHPDSPGWQQDRHIVLTPPERGYLLDTLEQHYTAHEVAVGHTDEDDARLSWIDEASIGSGTVQDLTTAFERCALAGRPSPTDVRAIAGNRQVRVPVTVTRSSCVPQMVVSVTLPDGRTVAGSYFDPQV